MAFATAAFGYSYTFQVTSNAAGTVDISLEYQNNQLPGGSESFTFNNAGTQTKTITPISGVPDCAQIHGEGACRPADHDYQTLDDVYPVTQINYVTVDIDGMSPPPDPGEGETED